MNPSQMPEPARIASGTGAVPHPSKSPMTATRAALGAQTANATPGRPPRVVGWAPRCS